MAVAAGTGALRSSAKPSCRHIDGIGSSTARWRTWYNNNNHKKKKKKKNETEKRTFEEAIGIGVRQLEQECLQTYLAGHVKVWDQVLVAGRWRLWQAEVLHKVSVVVWIRCVHVSVLDRKVQV